MKKNRIKKELSKLTKSSNTKSIFISETESEKKDDSLSISSEGIEEKMNRLILQKKLEKNGIIPESLPKTKNKIESNIIKDSKDKKIQEPNIIKVSKKEFEEKKIFEQKPIKKEKSKTKQKKIDLKELNSRISNANLILQNYFENNIKSSIYIFLENLKEFNEILTRKKRSTRKRKTQKMMVKKGTIRERLMKDPEKEKEKINEENIEEIEEYSLDELHEDEDTFIKLNNERNYEGKADNSQLDEYDLFYKEQFFRDELFRYDAENIQDKEEEDINKQMNKLDCKRRLKEKKKLKEVNDLKGLDTTELAKEIKKLTKEYENFKKEEEPKVELELNNTEKLLQKGRILGFYFKENQNKDFPHFSMYDFKEKGAKEIIDFKMLRKEEEARRYFDYHCLLEQRKKINEIMVYVRFYCRLLVDNPIFDYFSLLVIILNTVLILISDPTDNNNLGNLSDNYFLYFYTLECILKILAFRFWSAEDAYIKDYWNILDFFVVVVGWILFIIENALNGTKISGLAGLRAFRILRPLKTVKRFKGLKKLVTALLLALGHLGETGIVLFFFFLIFAIAGRQMWQGLFYRRCTNLNFGYLYSTQKYTYMCSFDSDCKDLEGYGTRFVCTKGYRNPDNGAFNFDSVLTGFVTIFAMATLEGWSDIFTYVSKTFKDKIYINPIIVFCYFHFFIFLANFYMLKLFLAITNAEYEHIEVSRRELTEKKDFFKLIQSKYDINMKEKMEKKEKERQLKESNLKKSDEALLDLYYKVGEEAFQINKNKRNIPILYSTVKDIYVMSNNTPEEIYLQQKRIEEEETFLSKDIKRLHKEIDVLIDQKRKEMKESSNLNKEADTNEKNEKDKDKNSNKKINNNLNKKERKGKSKDKLKVNKKNNKEKAKPKTTIIDIQKKVLDIKEELLELTIDNTQKYIQEKAFEISRRMTQMNDGNEDEKKDGEKKDNKKNSQIDFEDLPYEKMIKEKTTMEKRRKEELEKKNQEMKKLSKYISKKISKSVKKREEKKKAENKDLINKSNLSHVLSFFDDLNISKNEDKDELIRKGTAHNSVNKYLYEYDNNSKIEKKFINKISFRMEEDKNQEDIQNESSLISREEEIDIDDIKNKKNVQKIKTIKLNDEDELYSTVNFGRPASILNPVIKLIRDQEVQEKLRKMRENFNLNKFLEKEKEEGVNTDLLGRRKSYLDFLQYTEKGNN